MIQAPILHVNGDDPEAVMFVTQLAIDYRMQFKRDVVIDLVCYRRRGHNEADEPSGTQPLMYQQISKQRTTRELYADALAASGALSAEAAQTKVDEYRNALDNGMHVVKSLVKEPNKELFVDWRPYLGHAWTARHDTSFDLKTLQELSAKLMELPEGFVVQRQVQKIYEDRQKMQAGGLPINWGYAETMAYATLAFEGHPVRITGQDVGRGTFSHRHAVLHNQKDATTYVPLQNLYAGQPRFDLYDSFLSEEAVLAFEYGYSTTSPNALVIWEAQFGDFANGAQVVIDQFITSGEHEVAGRLCGRDHAVAARLRRAGAGALVRTPGALPAAVRRAQHGRSAYFDHPGTDYYHAAAPPGDPSAAASRSMVLTPKSLLRHKLAISQRSKTSRPKARSRP
jgi:2-oxoglutarate dehydrogenase E1 component